MADTGATDILDSLMRNMRDIISTKTIVGEPIQSNGTTILPLMRVALGFGAGAGSGMAPRTTTITTSASTNGNNVTGGGGGGGGGGISITPVGFLVVDQNRAVMVTPKSSKWDWVIETVPELIDRLTRMRQDKSRRDSMTESQMGAEMGGMGGPGMGGQPFPGEPPMGGGGPYGG